MKVSLTKNALRHVMKSEAERTVKDLGPVQFKERYMNYYQLIAKSIDMVEEIIVINNDCENALLDYILLNEDIDEMEDGKIYVMLFDGFVSVFDLTTGKQSVMIREDDFFSSINAFILSDYLENKFKNKATIKRMKI